MANKYLEHTPLACLSFLVAVLAAGSSMAGGPGLLARQLDANQMYLPERQPTLAPFAHVKFCMTTPDECQKREGARVIEITRAIESKLESINYAVNQSIRPRMDPPGEEVWHLDAAVGSCHDYAVTKRKRLLDAGFSSAAVRLAVARTAYGEGHAVVVVRTSKGDLVLDNRTEALKLWNKADLQWVKVESSDNPKMWLSL